MTLWPAFLMFLLLAINVPVAIAMIAPAMLYFFIGGDLPIDLVSQRIVSTTESFPLLALPFFVLAGSIMNAAGITRRLLALAEAFVGHFVGGLAQINILLATMMGGLTASANADAAMLAKMLGPSMVRGGYSAGFAAATIACSSVIVAMIPPSIGMIVYAYLANVSVGKLFIAGVIPGLLLAVALMVAVYLVSKKRGYVPARSKMATGKELWRAFTDSVWALSLPVFIIIGIRGGVFTPTEAGAIAVLYAAFVGVVLHRELRWKHVPIILSETIATTSVVMLIICSAATLGYYMVWEDIPAQLASTLISLTNHPGLLLLLINVLLLLVGMVIEGTAALILLTPILVPVILKLGIDPVHFGIIMVLNLTLGGAHPPVGTLLFTTCSILKVSLANATKESLSLLLAMLIVLTLVTAVPQISLLLPSLLMQ
ncbi:TRAP transporter large permease [Herbaspirillum chlorophenolicum]|jgi:tripartite ATP-independent transporter DctM subunit|uniref:TRAP transporter large permease protein n=1 Tax=Herbaspirillum chlorophenolicum TaxID=211589 RepID=A0ABW8F4P3_9BURK|nr:TRAP transporter large permease [Herbaspirillum chlorophenolicum]